jgi:hypothetical protein
VQCLSYPSLVVRVGGLDCTLTLPHKLRVTGWNTWLRAEPSRLTRDPYGRGWLFEGVGDVPAGLLQGDEARAWMAAEIDRGSRLLHGCLGDHPADGGVFAPGVLLELKRDAALQFFHEMFSPLGGNS